MYDLQLGKGNLHTSKYIVVWKFYILSGSPCICQKNYYKSLYIGQHYICKLVLVISVMTPVVDSYDGFLNNDFESWQDRPACSKEFHTTKIKITLYMG